MGDNDSSNSHILKRDQEINGNTCLLPPPPFLKLKTHHMGTQVVHLFLHDHTNKLVAAFPRTLSSHAIIFAEVLLFTSVTALYHRWIIFCAY